MKCRAMSNIVRNKPTSHQMKALNDLWTEQSNQFLSLYNKQATFQVLHILRFNFGFGKIRLKRFADKLAEMQSKTIERYEVTDEDVPDICEIQLRESGIDVDELLKEKDDV